MATTVQTRTAANNYLVRFHEYSPGETDDVKVWENPYVNDMAKIPSFIPNSSRQTTEAFKKAIGNAHEDSIFFLKPFRNALVVLRTNDLMSFRAANKCCYLATKSDSLWKQKIKFIFSNLTCIPKTKSRYSPEQQFEVAYNELQYRHRPYYCQFNHNLKKFHHMFPREMTPNVKIPPVMIPHVGWYATIFPSQKDNINALVRLFGRSCVATLQSIEPKSEQGRCLCALDFIYDEINNQEAFERMIQQSEVNCFSEG